MWLYRWRAFWLEPCYQSLISSERGETRRIGPSGEKLIFIQGFWRSGTTLLHEMLSELPNCGAPRTWQCMNPVSMMLPSSAHKNSRTVQRPMDKLLVSDESPQEDEFALMMLGVPSLYRGFLDPRRLPELTPMYSQEYWAQSASTWIRTFEGLINRFCDPGNHGLILKSPNHVFRYRALKAHYSAARFVWILRDPAEVWRSNLKMWQAMIDQYSLWKASRRTLEEFLEVGLESYASLLEELHRQRVFLQQPVFRYESLARSPATIFPTLIDRLEIGPWSSISTELQTRLLARPRAALDRRDIPEGAPLSLLKRLREVQESILSEFRL